MPGFQRIGSSQQRLHGILATGFCQLSRIDVDLFFPAIENIDLFWTKLGKVLEALVIEMCIGHRFAVKIQQLAGAENNRRAVFENAVICKCFDDHFGANAVDVSNANANDRFCYCTHTNENVKVRKGVRSWKTGSRIEEVEFGM